MAAYVWLLFGQAMPSGASVRLRVRYLSSEGYFLREDMMVLPLEGNNDKGDRQLVARAKQQVGRTDKWLRKEHSAGVKEVMVKDEVAKKYYERLMDEESD